MLSLTRRKNGANKIVPANGLHAGDCRQNLDWKGLTRVMVEHFAISPAAGRRKWRPTLIRWRWRKRREIYRAQGIAGTQLVGRGQNEAPARRTAPGSAQENRVCSGMLSDRRATAFLVLLLMALPRNARKAGYRFGILEAARPAPEQRTRVGLLRHPRMGARHGALGTWVRTTAKLNGTPREFQSRWRSAEAL
jgi:hypothetical protein